MQCIDHGVLKCHVEWGRPTLMLAGLTVHGIVPVELPRLCSIYLLNSRYSWVFIRNDKSSDMQCFEHKVAVVIPYFF